jgi:WD repeat-containing protein 70
MYREEHTTKRKLAEQARKDPKRSKRPEAPLTGPGVGGRVSSSYNFTQFVMQNKLAGQKTNIREQDAREELLKFADASEQEPTYFGGAYGNKVRVCVLRALAAVTAAAAVVAAVLGRGGGGVIDQQ